MSRRMLLAKGMVITSFAALAAKLGHLQLIEGEQNRARAESTIQRPETIKASRGVIYDRRGRELAINRQTWEVRVRPRDLPPAANASERRRVLDDLINALNLPDALVLDPNAVPAGSTETVYLRTAQLLGKMLSVEPTDQMVEHPVFSVPGQIMRINGAEAHIFHYDSLSARQEDWARISSDRRIVAGIPVPDDAHFAAANNVMTLVYTNDLLLVSRIERAVAELGAHNGPVTAEQVLATLRGNALQAWTDYIEAQKKINYVVVLEDDLTTDLAALCRAHLSELPGVKVMNRLDYLVENGRDMDQVIVRIGVPREIALKLAANQNLLPGVSLDASALVRHYPGGQAMSHILGYVGGVTEDEQRDHVDSFGRSIYEIDDVKGKDGIELVFEDHLRGQKGSQLTQLTVAGGAWLPVEGTVREPTPGQNLTLTIDLEFQRACSELLAAGIRYSSQDRWALAETDPARAPKKEPGAGAIVAIDPRNGEVLAMVSYPHYDNQLFVDGISQRKYDEYISEAANRPLVDRAVRGQYPPGSTLKLFMAAAALQERTITPETTYHCTGAIQVPFAWDQSKGNIHPCWIYRYGGHEDLNVVQALAQSCDVFFYNVGAPHQPIDEAESDFLHYRNLDFSGHLSQEKIYFEGLGIDRMKEHFTEHFCFGQQTGIELPAEAAGVAPDNEWRQRNFQTGWSVGDTINASIGQGFFEATPLQLAVNTATLANRGTVFQPTLIRNAGDRPPGATPTAGAAAQARGKLIRDAGYDAEVLDIVIEGMRRVCNEEIGSAFQYPDNSTRWPLTNPPDEPKIVLAGKTGTAELGEADENGLYDRQHAWFTVFAPIDDPEIAISVLVEDGGGGESYAVPVADRVLRAFFEINGRRPRGLVMRTDGDAPIGSDHSVLVETAAFPEPGSMAPTLLGQD
jgi:penicillin-binding protein 2